MINSQSPHGKRWPVENDFEAIQPFNVTSFRSLLSVLPVLTTLVEMLVLDRCLVAPKTFNQSHSLIIAITRPTNSHHDEQRSFYVKV